MVQFGQRLYSEIMRVHARHAAGLLLILIALAIAAAAWITHQRRQAEQRREPEVQTLARTLGILRTGTPTDPKVLKVLFYGQSITKSGWDQITLTHWHTTYPNTVFVAKNMALGGFGSVMLSRTDARDIQEFYPDLIVFHDYGDHRAYEQILRDFRTLTAADVILQTDHGEVLPDPICPEGLQTSLRRPPGCAGFAWLHQRLWSDEMSYHKLPALAAKYGVALEPQRGWWRDLLLHTGEPASAYLADQIHPNQRGKQVIADLFNGYLDRLAAQWHGETENTVRDEPLEPNVSFDGNRLELITEAPLGAPPEVMIDGLTPKQLDGCYQVTRSSDTQVEPDWPALRRITPHTDHTPADWTATIPDLSPEASRFRFTVASSADGEQGTGTAGQPFTSRDGLLSFEPDDWMLARAVTEKHRPIQSPFVVRWQVRFVCGADPEVIPLAPGRTQYKYVLATGLPNRTHAAQLKLAGAPNAFFRIYRPPLAGN